MPIRQLPSQHQEGYQRPARGVAWHWGGSQVYETGSPAFSPGKEGRVYRPWPRGKDMKRVSGDEKEGNLHWIPGFNQYSANREGLEEDCRR